MSECEEKLIKKLKEYQTLQNDLEKCVSDIDTILLLYNFDIDIINKKYPIIRDIRGPDKRSPVKRVRSWF